MVSGWDRVLCCSGALELTQTLMLGSFSVF